jgi:hypothetical protein
MGQFEAGESPPPGSCYLPDLAGADAGAGVSESTEWTLFDRM